MSLWNGLECGSPVSAGSIPGSRAQPPPPQLGLGAPPPSPPLTPEPSPALMVEGLREPGRRQPDAILPSPLRPRGGGGTRIQLWLDQALAASSLISGWQ